MIEILPTLDKHNMTQFKHHNREYTHIKYKDVMLYLLLDNTYRCKIPWIPGSMQLDTFIPIEHSRNIFQYYTHFGYSVVDSLSAGNCSEKLVLAPRLLRCAISPPLREHDTHEAIHQEKYKTHRDIICFNIKQKNSD